MKQTSVGISYCTGPYKDVLKQINLERLAAHGMDIGSTFLDPFFCVPKKHRMNIIYSHYEKLNAHLVHKLIFQRKDNTVTPLSSTAVLIQNSRTLVQHLIEDDT